MMTITLTFYIFLLSCLLAASLVDTLQVPVRQGGVSFPGAVSTQCRRSRHGRELFLSSPGAGPEENYKDDVVAVPPIPPPKGWSYPKFESIASTIDKHVSMDRSSMDLGKDSQSMVYILEEGFLPQDRTWILGVRKERMKKRSNVLYRPEIVNDLVQRIDKIFEEEEGMGLLVKGPLGVGKSYSLINLTRYLLASGNYWVTIIPDCETWENADNFFKFLLQSVGVDASRFRRMSPATSEADFEDLIADIDHVLSNRGKKWVFIFDQINRIFARKEFREEKDVGVLRFPFSLMKKVLKPGRITSVISASANNDVSYKENHPGFEDFDHPTKFDQADIELLYPASEVALWNWDEVDYATGRVPLYLSRWAKDESDDYDDEVHEEIKLSLEMLRREQPDTWKDFVDSAIQCVLHIPSDTRSTHFDRKYSIRKKETLRRGKSFNVIALFPLVEQSYRRFFWKSLFRQIKQRETIILNVCKDPKTTNDVRGRLFEEIVIARLVTDDLSRDDLKTVLAAANTTRN